MVRVALRCVEALADLEKAINVSANNLTLSISLSDNLVQELERAWKGPGKGLERAWKGQRLEEFLKICVDGNHGRFIVKSLIVTTFDNCNSSLKLILNKWKGFERFSTFFKG